MSDKLDVHIFYGVLVSHLITKIFDFISQITQNIRIKICQHLSLHQLPQPRKYHLETGQILSAHQYYQQL